MKKITPAQQQYLDMKQQHPDCVLLFRLGDFYELFYDDAKIAHKVLGITLTARDKQAENPIPMAGIPYHALERYLPQFVEAGYKVAIADQVGEVVPGKLVQRKITQIVTPGTRVEQNSLANYLFACTQQAHHWSCARGDATLGIWTTDIYASYDEVLQCILRLSPREIICDTSVREQNRFDRWIKEATQAITSTLPRGDDPERTLCHLLGVQSLEGYGIRHDAIDALALLFSYIHSIHQPIYVHRIQQARNTTSVLCDHLTLKNLEVFQGSYQGSKKHSLFGVINKCQTAMGSRLLAELLQHPTQDYEQLHNHHLHMQYWCDVYTETNRIRSLLHTCSDIPRIAQLITQKKRSVFWLRSLGEHLMHVYAHDFFVDAFTRYTDTQISKRLHEIGKYLTSLISDESTSEDDWIVVGYDAEVDKLRHYDEVIEKQLLDYQQQWITRSGVAVKVKYITNQGYSLEVTPKDIAKFEASIDHQSALFGAIRAQTLKTGQRYITPYLQDLQHELLSAKERVKEYHRAYEEKLMVWWNDVLQDIYTYAELIGKIDVHTTMAVFIHEHAWCLPTLTQTGDLHIIAGRHPVVEAFLPTHEHFIPNDTLCHASGFFHVITGPNMGGKSTYMRQQALIVLLAHAGLPVPAEQATVPLVDGIFARVGSGDVLAKQQSTFMTEMIETASILHNATHRSFLVIDELGRGTSTRDGLALAKAISVYICQYLKAKTLFATHYHELISLEEEVEGVENRHVGVHETEHEVVFLKKIYRGGADKSYGIDVAKLAGIPTEVLRLTKSYLELYDIAHQQSDGSPQIHQSSLFDHAFSDEHELYCQLRDRYASLDTNTITPLDALHILHEITLLLQK